MKIKRIEIEGFGKLVNQNYDFSQFTVVLGNNEAGKSTLLAFIKYMIFGFENKTKSNRDFYPQNSKIYGGKLLLELDEEEIWLERIKTKKSGTPTFKAWNSSGAEISEDEWLELISPMSANLFDQIYSITQENLQINREKDYDAESLDTQWRMALTTGTVALYDKEQDLIKEKNSIYTSPKAMSKPLNIHLASLEEIKRKISDKEAEEIELAPLIKESEVRTTEIANIRSLINQLEKDRQDLEHKLDYEEDYYQYLDLSSELEQAEPIPDQAEYDDLLAQSEIFSYLQSEISYLEKKVDANNEQLQLLDKPRNNFLLEADTRDVLNQIYDIYPQALEEEKYVNQVSKKRNNSWKFFLLAVIILTASSLIMLSDEYRIYAYLALALEVITAVIIYIYSKTSSNGQDIADTNAMNDFINLTSHFREWYQLPNDVKGQYQIIKSIETEIQNLYLSFERYDNLENEADLSQLYANLDDLLFNYPHVDNVPNMIRIWQSTEQKIDYQKRQYNALSKIFDLSEDVEINFDELARQVEEIESQIAVLNEKLNSLIDDNSIISVRIEQKKSDDSLEELQMNLELVRTELSETIKEYMLKVVQIDIIKNATASLSTHSLPDILQVAEEYLSLLTDGYWNQIDLDSDLLMLTNTDGVSLRLLDLSTGTRDQLQLAVRLAFIKAKNLNFPIFLDDSSLRYDKDRRGNLLSILRDVAREDQVIIFTSDRAFDREEKEKEVIRL